VIEQQPRPGDIGLTSIAGPVGWGIRLGQLCCGDGFTQWEHAFVVVDDGRLVEAEPGGARIAGLDEYAGRPVAYVAPAGLMDEQRTAICTAAEALIGTPYSLFDYLSLALVRFHIRPAWVRRYVADSRHMICSELVDFCYLQAGVHLFTDGRIPGDVTPADLANLLRE
jgi:uncharacterized protein YycO